MNTMKRWLWVAGGAAAMLVAAAAFAQSTEYRTFADPSGPYANLNPRVIVWVFAQLHLLFAAFVLAVPMFVLIIEIVGIKSQDPAQAKRYDDLAHEFCRLLTTAFSVTSILGAVFTFACLYLYPKFFSYLVEVFGPTMYLYSLIFFGESFSLYFYYYGWGKIRGWAHAGIGILLNVFGITLMLIANAWTTFMMSPGGVGPAGEVTSRYDAFFNFLLHPINIHRLIANLCMGGSVAAAYAAYNFLATQDPERRAHYDWMGYIGNFVAVLALLPLPFAGYYLGFEIYQYNQQLGIYMMGGTLSWLFILQAVLIGALFLGANYYLWLGMDRIEGSERYRGWIKWMLGLITLCVLVWSTPNSLVLTSGEIRAQGGTKHPIFSLLGVMSAKNSAVNLVILTTFLSFILYRRGNKEPTVPWATGGKIFQTLMFAGTAALVVAIGVWGYFIDSDTRVNVLSPIQAASVGVCIIVVMVVDLFLFRGAREVGRIRWGQVSARSQYALIFLAVTFTWTMGLMGFARSSLRQHWHVYEVMRDTSPWAFTPALGYATIVITSVVILFFLLVALVVWVSKLGAHEEHAAAPVPAPRWHKWAYAGVVVALLAGVVVGLRQAPMQAPAGADREALRRREARSLGRYDVADKEKEVYQVPIERAMQLLVEHPECVVTPIEGGQARVEGCPYW